MTHCFGERMNQCITHFLSYLSLFIPPPLSFILFFSFSSPLPTLLFPPTSSSVKTNSVMSLEPVSVQTGSLYFSLHSLLLNVIIGLKVDERQTVSSGQLSSEKEKKIIHFCLSYSSRRKKANGYKTFFPLSNTKRNFFSSLIIIIIIKYII